MIRYFIACALLVAPFLGATAAVDPNFYIYICFGQSNMEGNAQWESVDNTVDSRFQLLATTNFDSPKRTKGNWYKATPPLVSPWGKLGPTDYFGRTMVAALPAEVKVGVIPVAMGGSPIEMFDKDKYKQWMNNNPTELWTNLANQYYGGNPYGRIIEMAKKAKQVGVIKGILLHQGCSNNGNSEWPGMVKKIYNDMLTDLELGADSVPLFVGETEYADQGGGCSYHNTVVAKIPTVIPTGHIVSAKDVPGNGTDAWHFSAKGYRILGSRYAQAALTTMGREFVAQPDYQLSTTMKNLLSVKSIATSNEISAMLGTRQRFSVTATLTDGRVEDVSKLVTLNSSDVECDGSTIQPLKAGRSIVELTYTDFTRKQFIETITVDASFFPFSKDCFVKKSGTMTYDEATRSLTLTKNGLAGWTYNAGADMSDYKYLIVKLKEPQNCKAHVRVYNSYNTSGSCYRDTINDRTTVVIPLSRLALKNGTTIDPTKISMVQFSFGAAGTMKIDDVFLSNDEEYAPLSVSPLCAVPGDTPANVYNLQGMKVGTTAEWNSLPAGVYAVDGKLIQKKL